MIKNLSVFRSVKTWKKPLHITRAILSQKYINILKNIEVIGVTGSVGKTLTQNILFSVLSQKFKVVATSENLDPTFRIPKTILRAKPWDQKMILEFAVEYPNDMDYYLSIVKPKIAAVTTIAPSHTKYLTDVQGVFEEKSKLIKSLPKEGIAILNSDDLWCQKMAKLTKAKIYWYGEKSNNLVKISHFTQNFKGSKFRLHFKGQIATVSTKLIGKHQLSSVYIAADIGVLSGLTIKQIAKGIEQAIIPKHRLNLINLKKFSILDDTYNSSPQAVSKSIETLLDLGKNRQKIAVLGQMKDLGKLSENEHTKIGQKIAKTTINILITIGKAKTISESAVQNNFQGISKNFNSTDEAIQFINSQIKSKALILIKGSRHTHLERVVYGLQNKSTEINCYYCKKIK